MNSKHKSQVQKSKTKYIFGFEAYSKKSCQLQLFDEDADYKDCYSLYESTAYSFFRVTVYKIIREHGVIKHFLFGINTKSYDVSEYLCKNKLSRINIDFDDAYILGGPSGEFFQWILIARAHFAKNKSKKPLIVIGMENRVELLQMFLPDIPYILDKGLLSFDIERSYMEYAGHRFYKTFYCQKDMIYNYIKSIYIPYIYDVITELSRYGVNKNDARSITPVISNHSKEGLVNKIGGLNLNLDNFVIIANEAGWAPKPQFGFWMDITRKFKDQGVDVYQNFINQNNVIEGCKSSSEPLTYSEIFELACKAKAVISLRSGFAEIILSTLTPLIVIQTPGMLWFPKPADRNDDPLFESPYIINGIVRGVWYFDYDTNEDAADAVLSSYYEIITSHSADRKATK